MRIQSTAELGRLIRKRREAAGLTADAAARMAGVSRRLLIELELGKRRNVGFSAVLKILEILGLRLDADLRGLPGTMAEHDGDHV